MPEDDDIVDEKEETKTDVLKRIQTILKEYNYKERDIPVSKEPGNYWDLLNKYRSM